MAESPSSGTHQPESQVDANRTDVTIKQVVVYYSVDGQDFHVDIDPAKVGAVVWSAAALEKFKKEKTKEEPPMPGELPEPKPGKQHVHRDDEADAPEGTCCFINGRWVCW